MTSFAGIRLTTPLRTCVDLLLTETAEVSLCCLEDAYRRGLVSRVEIRTMLFSFVNRRGSNAANERLRRFREGTESALETISHLHLADAGLEPTAIQHVVKDRQGVFVARSDFLFVRGKRAVLGEADGRQAHQGLRVQDAQREERLRLLGFEVVRWNWSDVARDASRVVRRINAFLDRP